MIGIAVLAFLFCVGVAHVFEPDRFLRSSGVRKEGEILTEFNRIEFRMAGAAFAAFSGWLLYVLVRDLLGR